MRFSTQYIPTLKESPADAEVISHKLLLRAGMIRRLTSGLYTYLPLGLRALKAVEAIVREEMDRSGFLEVLLPFVQPGDLWKETGRWEQYGKELLRLKDRNDRDYCLGPTHEEVMTDLVRGEVRSYRNLPLRLYQMHTKFRDEIRPRFGLMRGREFIMKDGYSFDADLAHAEESYKLMYDCYTRIFSRLGLRFRAVEADTGSIGGNFSHEFMVLADSGEDTICYCMNCDYAANVERAEVVACTHCADGAQDLSPYEAVPTPNLHTVAEIADFLKTPKERVIKTMLFRVDGKVVAVLVRGDHEVNDVKLARFCQASEVELADQATVEAVTHAPLGFAGPVGLTIPIYADASLSGATGCVVGGNAKDTHLRNVSLARDVTVAAFADLRTITENDPCPRCGGQVKLTRGIEVGHIFMLGTKYSDAMHATFLNERGEEHPMIMGCYGIGISRVLAAAIEQNNDADGIVFPWAMAPVSCILLNLDVKNADVTKAVEKIYAKLEGSGVSVLLDDRDERAGVKFKDADLLGIPAQLSLGARSLKNNCVECANRLTKEKTTLPLERFDDDFPIWLEGVRASWDARRKTA
ncbi:MAG: proline--tRNA ligase [Desulfovibrionaceae bacterium]|nr:proline--tRNA ligase [Desulfovibrionaceae bacterium]